MRSQEQGMGQVIFGEHPRNDKYNTPNLFCTFFIILKIFFKRLAIHSHGNSLRSSPWRSQVPGKRETRERFLQGGNMFLHNSGSKY